MRSWPARCLNLNSVVNPRSPDYGPAMFVIAKVSTRRMGLRQGGHSADYLKERLYTVWDSLDLMLGEGMARV